MLEDMRQGAIKVLVCWWSDRIERRGPEALFRLLRLTRDAGGRIESTHEPLLGSGDISGGAMTELNAMMARHESIKISERIKKGHDRIKVNGATSSRVPWGYYTEGPKYNRLMVPIDICRKYLPLVLKRCIGGDSCRTIATWLTAEGVPTMKGRPWNEGQIRQLIKNRTYAGRRTRNNDTETYQRCEAVVSMDLWERANEALRSRPRRGATPRGGNPPMLAKLRCLRCDSPMYRIKAGTGNFARYYYRCFGSGPQRKGCGSMVPYELLERMVAVRFLAWNDKTYQIAEWKEGKSWDAEIAQVQQDIRELAQNPMAEDFLTHMAEKQAELADYIERNNHREPGHYDYIDVLNADGSPMTIGQHFFDLDSEGRREHLKTHEIGAERTGTRQSRCDCA